MAQLENFRLKVFRTVAEHLNFHKFAERLFLTQPAVTLQIKALESDLGVRLFDRKGGKVSLTRQGSILLTYANKLAALVSDAERELGCKEGQVSGNLSLGVSTTIAQYVLARLLAAFLSEYPHIELAVHSGNTSEIVRLLLDGQVAIGLIEGGQAGLAVSYCLARENRPHIVLERAEKPGEAWRNHRWDSFTLNTPNWQSGLPGAELPGSHPDGFLSREEVVAYFENYVTRFQLPV